MGNGIGIPPQPQLTWPNIISTVAVVLTMALGAWTLLQSQRSSDREYFQGSIDALNKRDQDLRAQLEKEVQEIRSRRTEFLTLREVSEITKRIDAHLDMVNKQIGLLEQLRPTTSELRANIEALQHRLNVQAERIMSIDRDLRAPRAGEATPKR